jgi:hypothetical protein
MQLGGELAHAKGAKDAKRLEISVPMNPSLQGAPGWGANFLSFCLTVAAFATFA